MIKQEFLQVVFEHMQELAIAFDAQGVIMYANNAAILSSGYSAGLSGRNVKEIFPELEALNTEMFDGKYRNMNAYRSNNTVFPVKAMLTREGESFVIIAVDITENEYLERKVANSNQEMEDALKVKSQFVANVTHELRTPVNGILGNSRELAELETDPKKLRLLDLVERGCKDMNSIINNILDFSKLEAGKFTLENRPFDFYSMMDYIKSNHLPKLTEKGIDFVMTISPQVPRELVGDELRICQILNNLLSNAAKFTSVGKIAVEVVRTAYTGNRVELFFLVMDTGIGMDAAEQDKLFKSFSQVDASISRRFGGTGLGLNISKQLVELMNGRIQVQSEKHKGSTFSFSIWLDLPSGTNLGELQPQAESNYKVEMTFETSDMRTYGTTENLEEIKKKMQKLILSVEMENWEKAEGFADTVKELTNDAPREIKSLVLRLKMSVAKADHDKTVVAFENLKEAFENNGQ